MRKAWSIHGVKLCDTKTLQIKLISFDQENKLHGTNFSQTPTQRAKHLRQVKTAHFVEVYEAVVTQLLHTDEPMHTCLKVHDTNGFK